MQVLIVDDEPLARERLAQMIEKIDNVSAAGGAGSGREAVEQARALQPSVVLLDIRMPDMDGLEAAHHMRRLDAPPFVIFCTAYDQYALAAFDAHAVDYLVKPIRIERLKEALDKASRFGASNPQPIPPPPQRRTHLCARVRGNLELVRVEDIFYLHAEHKYVTVVHSTGELLIEEPLKSLEAEFPDHFLRVHRNALVAKGRISGLSKGRDGPVSVCLRGTEETLEVSRRCLPSVRKAIKQL